MNKVMLQMKVDLWSSRLLRILGLYALPGFWFQDLGFSVDPFGQKFYAAKEPGL